MILYSFRRCPWAMRARLALRYAQCPVASDMRYCIITDLMSKEAFKREYPKASASEAAAWEGLGDSHKSGWTRDDGVIVAEYYWIDLVSDTLVLLQDGSTAWKSEIKEESQVVSGKTRSSMRRTVKWAKLSGKQYVSVIAWRSAADEEAALLLPQPLRPLGQPPRQNAAILVVARHHQRLLRRGNVAPVLLRLL